MRMRMRVRRRGGRGGAPWRHGQHVPCVCARAAWMCGSGAQHGCGAVELGRGAARRPSLQRCKGRQRSHAAPASPHTSPRRECKAPPLAQPIVKQCEQQAQASTRLNAPRPTCAPASQGQAPASRPPRPSASSSPRTTCAARAGSSRPAAAGSAGSGGGGGSRHRLSACLNAPTASQHPARCAHAAGCT